MATERWDRAALVPVRRGERRAEMMALPPGLPTVEELFTFMRDAERRFETLLMRIEERTYGARGEQVVNLDVAIRHPGHARSRGGAVEQNGARTALPLATPVAAARQAEVVTQDGKEVIGRLGINLAIPAVHSEDVASHPSILANRGRRIRVSESNRPALFRYD